jgi:glutamyl-tRNA reductase
VTRQTGLLSGVSVSHHRAGVDEIEAVSRRTQSATVERLLDRDGVDEAFVLQTCNRAEAFVVTEEAKTGREALASYVSPVPGESVDELDHETSLRHLMRVAAGLESLVLGEDQILGQFREAYEETREAGGIGPVLEDALLKAIHVGERARTETSINEGVTSLGSAAVGLAATDLPVDIEDASTLVVGAGEMGALAATALDRADAAEVSVANRSLENAAHLAESLDCPATVLSLEELPGALAAADLVVSATASPRHVLTPAQFDDAGETLVVDLAQPRDVDPEVGTLPHVTLHDLDTLEAVTAETREARREAAAEVEAIIDEAFENLVTQYKRKRADEVIGAMYEGAERLKAREVDTALSRLEATDDEFSDEQREVVESLADALVGQLLAPPTQSLRDAAENDDWSTINTALHLFGPALRPGPTGEDEDTNRDTAPTGLDDPPRPQALDAGELSPEDIPDEMRQRMPRGVLERLGDD